MKALGALALCPILGLAGCGHYRVADDPAINTQAYADTVAKQQALMVEEAAARKKAAAEAEAVCDKKGGVRIGMTRDQVYASCWGKPKSINSTIVAGRKHDQLVYGLSSYVYLDNGVVTAIQTREK